MLEITKWAEGSFPVDFYTSGLFWQQIEVALLGMKRFSGLRHIGTSAEASHFRPRSCSRLYSMYL